MGCNEADSGEYSTKQGHAAERVALDERTHEQSAEVDDGFIGADYDTGPGCSYRQTSEEVPEEKSERRFDRPG